MLVAQFLCFWRLLTLLLIMTFNGLQAAAASASFLLLLAVAFAGFSAALAGRSRLLMAQLRRELTSAMCFFPLALVAKSMRLVCCVLVVGALFIG
jgi:hypothetical protein